jgi:hypothetical protein
MRDLGRWTRGRVAQSSALAWYIIAVRTVEDPSRARNRPRLDSVPGTAILGDEYAELCSKCHKVA